MSKYSVHEKTIISTEIHGVRYAGTRVITGAAALSQTIHYMDKKKNDATKYDNSRRNTIMSWKAQEIFHMLVKKYHKI